MKFLFSLFIAVVLLCRLSEPTYANKIADQQVQALRVVFMELRTHYGMTKYKSEQFGLNLDELEAKYERLIREAKSLSEELGLVSPTHKKNLSQEEFEQLLIGLASEFRDGHLNILRVFTNENWTLGIYSSAIDYRLYVTGFDPKLFAKGLSSIEPKIGDEILSVNGVSVDDLAKQIEPYTQLATHQSRMNFAYQLILNRPHMWLPKTESNKPVKIEFRRTRDGEEALDFSATYHWVNQEALTRANYLSPHQIPIPEAQKYVYGYSETKSMFSEGLRAIEEDVDIIDFAEGFNADILRAHELIEDDETARSENRARVFPINRKGIESLAHLEPRHNIPVYIIRHRAQNIAVIRIKDYNLEIEDMEWLIFMMKKLNQMSDVLIIDQLANAGGSTFAGSEFVRLFANDNSLESTSIDLRLNRPLLYELESWNLENEELRKKRLKKKKKKKKSDSFIEADEQEIEDQKPLEAFPERSFARLLLDQERIDALRKKLQEGLSFSGPVSDFGSQIENLEGSPGLISGREGYVYSKPILVLNDCLSGSCGDFIPAILQANKRALIFGETSMGLGGPVYRYIDYLPGSEMFMRCTSGFCLRPDGLPIENLGVVPDIARWLEHDDLLDGFASYAANALDIAIDLAEGTSLEKIRKAHRKALSRPEPRTAVYISFRKLYNDLERKVSRQNLSAEGAIAAYLSFFEKLDDPKFSSVGKNYRDHLSIPLPIILLQSDVILASLRTGSEIKNRLQQLLKLKNFSQHRKLIQFLVEKMDYFEFEKRLSCSENLAHFVKNK